jgi:hypothetical protein
MTHEWTFTNCIEIAPSSLKNQRDVHHCMNSLLIHANLIAVYNLQQEIATMKFALIVASVLCLPQQELDRQSSIVGTDQRETTIPIRIPNVGTQPPRQDSPRQDKRPQRPSREAECAEIYFDRNSQLYRSIQRLLRSGNQFAFEPEFDSATRLRDLFGNQVESYGPGNEESRQGRNQFERVVIVCQKPGGTEIQLGEQRPPRQREGQLGQNQRWVEAQT